MKIQQKENETLAAYIHCFKMETKRCDSNNDIATIHMFIKGLVNTYNIAEKCMERTPDFIWSY